MCLHFQDAGTTGKKKNRLGLTSQLYDPDEEPLGPYIPAVRKAVSGSRAGG